MQLFYVTQLAASEAISTLLSDSDDMKVQAALQAQADAAKISDDYDKGDTRPVPDDAFKLVPAKFDDFSKLFTIDGVEAALRETLVRTYLDRENAAKEKSENRKRAAVAVERAKQLKAATKSRRGKTGDSSAAMDYDDGSASSGASASSIGIKRNAAVELDRDGASDPRGFEDLTAAQISEIADRYNFTRDAIGNSATITVEKKPGQTVEPFEGDLISSVIGRVYGDIEIALSEVYFQLRQDGRFAVLTDAAATRLGLPKQFQLFTKMAHFPLWRLSAMADKIKDGEGFLYSKDRADYPFIYRRGSKLWIPQTVQLFLYDIGASLTAFAPQGNGWTGAWVDDGMISVARFTLDGQVTIKALTNPGTGTGPGGGEFRADQAAAFVYRWFYQKPASWDVPEDVLVGACGLVPEWKCASADADERPDGYERVPTVFPGFTYWRKWVDLKKQSDKKNRPKSTIPLPVYTGLDNRRFDKAELLAKFPNDAFARKKMKGAWNVARLWRSGVKLRRQPARDTQAGPVMSKALKALGVPGANASATKVVEQTLLWDGTPPPPLAAEFWQRFSQDVEMREGAKGDQATLRRALRTDQEWCHLHGHGDGGKEILENFVAGSEHANSEQLAIESAQRPWFTSANLTARITAYLMPAPPVARTALFPIEKKILTEAGFVEADFQSIDDDDDDPLAPFRTKYAPLLAAFADDADSKTPSSPDTAAAKAAREEAFASQLPAPVQAKYRQSAVPSRWLRKLHEDMLPMVALPPPIAFAVRYKILVEKPPHPPQKVFDHLIQMQRESFDIIEYRLLLWAVQMAIARRIDEQIAANAAPDPSGATGSSSAVVGTNVTDLLETMRGRAKPPSHTTASGDGSASSSAATPATAPASGSASGGAASTPADDTAMH